MSDQASNSESDPVETKPDLDGTPNNASSSEAMSRGESNNPLNTGDPSNLHPDTAATTPQNPSKKEPLVQTPSPEAVGLDKKFHVFTWLNEKQPTSWPTPRPTNDNETHGVTSAPSSDDSFSIDESRMKSDLKEIDYFLKHRTSFEERLVYKKCSRRTRQDVYDLMEKEEKDVANLKDHSSRKRVAFENKVELLNKAESLLQFFLPSDFDGPTVSTFWGALYVLLKVSSPLLYLLVMNPWLLVVFVLLSLGWYSLLTSATGGAGFRPTISTNY
jgi:hypothetical protein